MVSEKALVLWQFGIECSFEAIKLIGLIHEIWKKAGVTIVVYVYIRAQSTQYSHTTHTWIVHTHYTIPHTETHIRTQQINH